MKESSLRQRIRFLGSVALTAGLVFALPTMIVLCFALIPTLVAYMVDPYKRSRYLSICVFSTNLAAVMPFIFQLWDGGNGLTEAINIIAYPVVWLTVLCGAAVGWIFYGIFPRVVSSYVVNMWKYKISSLQKHQQRLTETWGEGLKTQLSDSDDLDDLDDLDEKK